jgi:hypothetical protein
MKPVPVRQQSQYVAEVSAKSLSERDQRLVAACEVANKSHAIRAVERDWGVITDELLESWDHPASLDLEL